ncbi:MAG: ATP-binding protein [Patescibacteria group bacterium]|nr:ATP-binding protein [Patescibacteria group bacterium]
MKIAIIGTHSTGKTTLVQKLKNKLEELGKKVMIIQEHARSCPFPVHEGTTIEAQKWIKDNQIAKESEVDHSDKILITDRATIDNFAYLHRVADEETSREYEQIAFEHGKTYTFIFKTHKLDIVAEDDGFRTTDDDFRNLIDSLINQFLKKNQVQFIPLQATTDYDVHVKDILERINT